MRLPQRNAPVGSFAPFFHPESPALPVPHPTPTPNSPVWHYLFMIIHIREKDPNDYNGWEGYVAQMIKNKDLNFFPQLDAISLSKFKAREREETRKQLEMAANTAKTVENLETLVQTTLQNQEKMMEEVREIQSRLEEPNESQKRLESLMRSIEARLSGGTTTPVSLGERSASSLPDPRASARG